MPDDYKTKNEDELLDWSEGAVAEWRKRLPPVLKFLGGIFLKSPLCPPSGEWISALFRAAEGGGEQPRAHTDIG